VVAQWTGMKHYWVYMLRCRDGSYYVGVTSNVDVRAAAHALGLSPRSYVYKRRPATLVHAEVFARPDDAIAFEKQLKGWSRAKKEALIRGDWAEIRRLSRSRSAHDHRPSTSSG
jgi:predicted GIY-YIG superfamily endonuclease